MVASVYTSNDLGNILYKKSIYLPIAKREWVVFGAELSNITSQFIKKTKEYLNEHPGKCASLSFIKFVI